MTAESPCIGVCALDLFGHGCVACHRTLQEIAAWSGMTEAEKLEVLRAVEERRIREVETKREQ